MSNPKKRALLVPVTKGDPSLAVKKLKTETGAKIVYPALPGAEATDKENQLPELGEGLSLGGSKSVSPRVPKSHS